ncbi:MAG: endonuclease NucS domain-containing protein [Candidatus Bathyarchaeia archaeon]|jgi:hypothetical protein
MVNLLIPYRRLTDHKDPILEEFTYGDVDARARKLKRDLKQGDYVFFHTTIRGKKRITAYYVIDKVLDTSIAASNIAIVAKYENPHIKEYISGERRNGDDVIAFGDTVLSQKLKRPLTFDKELADQLSLGIFFKKKFTYNRCISDATRQWRELSDSDVQLLIDKINKAKEEGVSKDTILSTDEVMEILEADLEGFIAKNPTILGSDLVLDGRQVPIPLGRVDLVYKDKTGGYVLVELKLRSVGTEALNQLRGYMNYYRAKTKQDVRGIIVCKDIMPAFEEKYQRLSDIKTFFYGWKLQVFPLE